mgnify:CR=1 FL=1
MADQGEQPETQPVRTLDERTIPFFPDLALREAKLAWAVLLIVIVGAAILAAVLPLELAAPADPFNPPAHPKPEWYFLFLYEFLKYVPGELRVGETAIMKLGPVCGATIPVLGLILLLAVPFLDRRQQDSRRAQRFRLYGVIAFFVIFLILTLLGARGAVMN